MENTEILCLSLETHCSVRSGVLLSFWDLIIELSGASRFSPQSPGSMAAWGGCCDSSWNGIPKMLEWKKTVVRIQVKALGQLLTRSHTRDPDHAMEYISQCKPHLSKSWDYLKPKQSSHLIGVYYSTVHHSWERKQLKCPSTVGWIQNELHKCHWMLVSVATNSLRPAGPLDRVFCARLVPKPLIKLTALRLNINYVLFGILAQVSY